MEGLERPLSPHLQVYRWQITNTLSILHRDGVSDGTYQAVFDRFGERGVMDLIAVNGYYGLVSMTLNVDRTPLAGGAPPPLPPLPRKVRSGARKTKGNARSKPKSGRRKTKGKRR